MHPTNSNGDDGYRNEFINSVSWRPAGSSPLPRPLSRRHEPHYNIRISSDHCVILFLTIVSPHAPTRMPISGYPWTLVIRVCVRIKFIGARTTRILYQATAKLLGGRLVRRITILLLLLLYYTAVGGKLIIITIIHLSVMILWGRHTLMITSHRCWGVGWGVANESR